MSDHRGHCHANRLARQCEKKKQNEAILVFMSFKGFGRVWAKEPVHSNPVQAINGKSSPCCLVSSPGPDPNTGALEQTGTEQWAA